MSTLTPLSLSPSTDQTTPPSAEGETTKPSSVSERTPTRSLINYTTPKRAKLRNLFSSTKPSLQRFHITNSNQLLSSKPQRANPNDKNPLACLPTSVLLCISDFLQHHQIALFSLTCTSILVKLGTESLSSLICAPDPAESFEYFTQRRHLLILLSEDDLQSRYCDHCYRIHSYVPPHLKKGLQKVKARFSRLSCEDILHNWQPWNPDECQYFFRDNLLNFTRCQALMKEYRHSLRPSTGVKTHVGVFNYFHLEHKIFARRVMYERVGRIRDGRLLVRTEWRVFIPFGADEAEIDKRTRDVKACGHLCRSTAGTTFFDRVVTGRAEEGLERLDPELEDDISNPPSPSSLSPISPISDQEPIPFALRSASPSSSFSSSDQPANLSAPITYSCALCPTDYTTSFRAGRAPRHPARFGKHKFSTAREQKDVERGIFLILSAFTDLGECRDIWEEVWNCGPHSNGKGKCRSRSGWPVLEKPRERGRGDGVLGAWDKGGEVGIYDGG